MDAKNTDMNTARAEIWWLEVDTVTAPHWPRLEALLAEEERQRASRFHFEHDRQCYIAAHALGRRLLSHWAGGEPADWRFVTGDHGKPEVVGPEGLPRLRLNLSHTRGLAAVALTEEHDIGIDVEWLAREADCLGLGQRFFAAAECQVLLQSAPERLTETFLSFWTLKEAYVKAIGKGLAQPLNSFFFTLEPPAIAFADAVADDAASWLFRQLRPTDRHLLALALKHPRPTGVTVTARAMTAEAL